MAHFFISRISSFRKARRMLLERGLPIADTPGGLGASIGARDGGLAFGNAGVVDGAELGDTVDLVLLVAAV